uniref:cytochrome c oxidase subunit 7A2, mitochondrial-like n=1 Tax=Myxine glutinosa TaxID=7769 RepID=UPI00358F3A4C
MRALMMLGRVTHRGICTTQRRALTLRNKVPELQTLFQKDNDVPVHLKGGPKDILLYGTTMSVSALGVGWVFYAIYQLL